MAHTCVHAPNMRGANIKRDAFLYKSILTAVYSQKPDNHINMHMTRSYMLTKCFYIHVVIWECTIIYLWIYVMYIA